MPYCYVYGEKLHDETAPPRDRPSARAVGVRVQLPMEWVEDFVNLMENL